MNPTLPAEVFAELRAMHWSSHGNGATTAEIVGALRLRGIDLPPSDTAARWQVALVLGMYPDRRQRLRTPNGEEVLRGDLVVLAPTDPIETGIQYQ